MKKQDVEFYAFCVLLLLVFVFFAFVPHVQGQGIYNAAVVANGSAISRGTIKKVARRNVVVVINSESMCSGVVYDDYLVLTAAHCGEANIKVNGKEARVVKRDVKLDLMLLSTENLGEYTKLKFDEKPQVFDEVFYVGNPIGHRNTLSVGRITFYDRTSTHDWVHSDTLCQPGFSGAGLFNVKGELVGIQSKMEQPVEGTLWEPVALAIPAYKVKKFVEEL